MNILLWIIAGQLALAFLATGVMKLAQPKQKLAENGMGWTEDFSAETIKTIGALELFAAFGLIVPAVFHVRPVLVPLAALGLLLLMFGAATTHAMRKESRMDVVNLVLAALAALVVWGRFGPHSFGA